MEITASDCRTILENAAARMENGWKIGGKSGGFLPSAIDEKASKLCLVDSVALETRLYLSGLLPEDCSPAQKGRISTKVKWTIIPALIIAIKKEPAAGKLTDDACCYLEDVRVIWNYNDFICEDGSQAAEIARKAAKEL